MVNKLKRAGAVIEQLELRRLLSAATTTALTETTQVLTYGQSNTFTATVSATTAGAPVPTGTVYFYAYNSTYPSETVPVQSDGTAQLPLAGTIPGYMAFIAYYSGDANYAASNSGAVFAAVNQTAIVPTITGNTVPAKILTNAKVTGKVTVTLNNPTGEAITDFQGINVFALTYLGGSFSSTDIGSAVKFLTVPADSSKPITITVKPSLVDGVNDTYSILATVTNSARLSSFSATAVPADLNTAFTVAPASVDLAASVTVTSPASLKLLPGKSFSTTLEVFNYGNNLASGPTQVTVSTSPNADGTSPTFLVTFPEHLHIAAGGHQKFHLTAKVPLGTIPGTYYFVTDIDPLDTFSETNITNNISVSTNALTVLPPYPNILGGYTGTWIIKKGRDKGDVITQTGTYTFESQTTGGFLVSGTNYFSDGTSAVVGAAGTVSTKGVYLIDGTVVSKGKVSGGHIKGTFVFEDGSGDAGTFDWTLTG